MGEKFTRATMPENRKTQLLIVYSDAQIRRYLEELLLPRETFKLTFCDTPAIAQQIANELLPDAILLDSDLQGMDSAEICRRVRLDAHLAGTPLLVMLDPRNRKAKAQAFEAGADDFISKPLDALELLARLRTLTRLQYYDKMFADLERFKWMAVHAQEGYLLLDSLAIIQYANERAVNMLNLPEEPVGMDFIAAVQAHYVARPAETWQTWFEDPSPCFLMRPENINARAFWMVLEGLDTDIGAEPQRIVRLRDVTEKMSIYQDIRRFHDTITHKLRTPVSLLATSVSLINSQMEKLSEQEIRELMQTAAKGTERLVWQVRDVLTYVDAPLSIQIGEPISVGQIPNMVAELGEKYGIQDIELSMSEDLSETRIALTPDALDLVLGEAFENAKKFHPRREPKVEFSIGQPKEGQLMIRITDDGMTLSAEQLGWAWLPYFQGEKSFTGEMPGMGLGFPLMATLVWGTGGALRLCNRANGPGVVVEMKIPVIATERTEESPHSRDF
jgi:two-component system, cell cycle response regulator